MSKNRERVYAHVKQDRLILDNGETPSNWTGSDDVSGIEASTNHREGSGAISFDKSGSTQAFGQISRTFPEAQSFSLAEYQGGIIRYWAYISSVADVTDVELRIGDSDSNCYEYQTEVASLQTGWNLIEVSLDSPTNTNGDGADWNSINYLAFRVTFGVSGNTLSDILLDGIAAIYELEGKVAGEDNANDVLKTEFQGSYHYVATAAVNEVIKSSGGFLYGVIIGEDVAAATIEISDHATDGDGNVKIFLSGDTLMTSVGGFLPVNAQFTNGISADIVNQTKVTFVFR